MLLRHGRHWPREEQNANAYEGFGNLLGDEAAAARVREAWAATLPPYQIPDDPWLLEQPEFNNMRS